ncbi:STAS domain-containing protein [Spirillospora albida]|uniref:STAS domain-containing protein n=1 Tax=Spirillospora albida TaxID=58123 RepID=UPI0004C109EC|nr:STAS domain-containing protein [Spirillospora albida]
MTTDGDDLTCGNGALVLKVEVRGEEAAAELRLSGHVDVITAAELREHIGAVIAGHDPHLLLMDLSGVGLVDSSGLSLMVWAHQEMTGRGRRFALRHPQPRVLRVLRMTGLHTRLDIIEARVEPLRRAPGAMRRFGRSGSAPGLPE